MLKKELTERQIEILSNVIEDHMQNLDNFEDTSTLEEYMDELYVILGILNEE